MALSAPHQPQQSRAVFREAIDEFPASTDTADSCRVSRAHLISDGMQTQEGPLGLLCGVPWAAQDGVAFPPHSHALTFPGLQNRLCDLIALGVADVCIASLGRAIQPLQNKNGKV